MIGGCSCIFVVGSVDIAEHLRHAVGTSSHLVPSSVILTVLLSVLSASEREMFGPSRVQRGTIS